MFLLFFILPPTRSNAQSATLGPGATGWKPDYRSSVPVAEASIATRPWIGKFPFVGQVAASSQKQANPSSDQSQDASDQSPDAPEPSQATPDQSQHKEKINPPATSGSPGHMYWVVPAFKVDYSGHFQPLTPKEKFKEWAQGVYDPLGLGVTAFEAGTLEYRSADGFCGYGHGWGPYGQCFGSLEADGTISSFIGDYALAVWWHQDPRYFRLGKGSFGKRVLYSISRVFIAYNDSGHNVFDSSALSGTVIASAISNLYSPQQDRGVSNSISRAGLDLGNTAIYNAAAEFWPDIHRGLHRMF